MSDCCLRSPLSIISGTTTIDVYVENGAEQIGAHGVAGCAAFLNHDCSPRPGDLKRSLQ